MLKFNNDHIFTGYLKQLLSSTYLPTCRVYTREHQRYLRENGKESPEILESVTSLDTLAYNDHVYTFPYIRLGKVDRFIYTESGTSTNESDATGTCR